MKTSTPVSLLSVTLTALAVATACGGKVDTGGSSGRFGGSGSGQGGSTGGSAGSTGGTGASGGTGTGGFGGTGPPGGFGGTGPSGGFGGTGTGGFGGTGTGGSGGGNLSPTLGKACATDAECDVGSSCVTADSGRLGGGGPPKGMCTRACNTGPGDTCGQLAAGATCLNFGTASAPAAFCVEGCTFGPTSGTSFLPTKCHGRHEFACGLLFNDTSATCVTDSDCSANGICNVGDTNTCLTPIPACLPQCNKDADCGVGLFCSPRDGTCSPTAPTGLAIGANCTPVAVGGTEQCKGQCIGIVDGVSSEPITSMCVANCTSSEPVACGWAGPTSGQVADAFCLFSSTVVSDMGGPGAGDQGQCGQLCNCNADCLDQDLVCMSFGSPQLESALKRQGYCYTPDPWDAGAGAGIPTCP